MKRIIRKELFPLFLIIVFPIHTWSIILIFYNFGWISERTEVWDAVGFGAYSLSFAFLESIFFFLIISPMYLILRKNRGSEVAKPIIGSLFIITAIWEMINRFNVYKFRVIERLIFQFGSDIGFPYRFKVLILIILITFLVAGTIGLFPFLLIKYNKLQTATADLLKRFELMSIFYLTLDIICISIVIIRNQVV